MKFAKVTNREKTTKRKRNENASLAHSAQEKWHQMCLPNDNSVMCRLVDSINEWMLSFSASHAANNFDSNPEIFIFIHFRLAHFSERWPCVCSLWSNAHVYASSQVLQMTRNAKMCRWRAYESKQKKELIPFGSVICFWRHKKNGFSPRCTEKKCVLHVRHRLLPYIQLFSVAGIGTKTTTKY